MSLRDSYRSFVRAVEVEYDRRIRAASNVRKYMVGGHGTQAHEAGEYVPDNGHVGHAERERQQGEGGAVGRQQSNAGPHLDTHD